jgi:hypothetical protein
MARELLFRLMRNGKIAGYEEHLKDEITGNYYIKNTAIYNDNHQVSGSYCTQPILCDRKDRYTGIDIDGEKVFERDIGLVNGHIFGDSPVTVVYKAPSFKVKHGDGTLYDLNEYFYKLIGISGVTTTEQRVE